MTRPLLNICAYSEYEPGAGGFVIEREYWPFNADAPSYAIPAWEEMGLPDLAEVFPTRAAAQAAIDLNA